MTVSDNPFHDAAVFRTEQKSKLDRERRKRQREALDLLRRQEHMFRRALGYYD